MRVLQLGPFPPPHGGIQTNLVAIRRYLQERGECCHVINLTRYRQQEGDGVYFPRSALEVLKLLFGLRWDVAHLHIGGDITLRLLLLALVISWLPGRRSVLTLHSGGYPQSPEGKAARAGTLRGFVFRRLDRLIAVNPALVDVFLRFGVAPGRIRLIHPHPLPSARDLAPLPAALEEFFASHDPVLLSLGWLEPEYDFSLQIRTLGPVRSAHPRAGLVILGAGRLEAALREQIAAGGLQDHVLMPGDVPHAVALTAIARASVFLRTTWYDGDSISVREALHLGTPVVASDNGMRPPGVILFPLRDASGLRAGIDRALDSPRPPSRLGEGGEQNIAAVVELYREMLGAAGQVA